MEFTIELNWPFDIFAILLFASSPLINHLYLALEVVSLNIQYAQRTCLELSSSLSFVPWGWSVSRSQDHHMLVREERDRITGRVRWSDGGRWMIYVLVVCKGTAPISGGCSVTDQWSTVCMEASNKRGEGRMCCPELSVCWKCVLKSSRKL